MAFMGMVIATIFSIILIIHIVLMLIFFILALVLKIVGSKKESKKMKNAGTVFLVLGIVFALPVIALIIYVSFHTTFTAVTLPDGETKYVRTRSISKMDSYLNNPDENSLNALDKLLDKNSSLVFYHDINRESILDDGLEMGNADIVRMALEHGAIFDNPERYDYKAYEKNSMDSYLGYCIERSITEEDIEIVEIMFENNVSTELEIELGNYYYSNMLGKAVWAVLYNDEAVTDIELDFIQTFIDNGLSPNKEFLLMEEVPSNYSFPPEYNANVTRNGNYYKLMDFIGR